MGLGYPTGIFCHMRPSDLAAIMAVFLDDDDRRRVRRLRPEALGAAVEQFRCRRRGHLQGVVLRTVHGPVALWRPADAFAGTARDIWQAEWLDQAPDVVPMTCHCGVKAQVSLSASKKTALSTHC